MFVRGESCVAHVIVEVLFRLVHHHTHRAGGAHAARHGRRRQEERRGSEHEWQHIYAEGISTSSVWGVASSEVFLREMRELAELDTYLCMPERALPLAVDGCRQRSALQRPRPLTLDFRDGGYTVATGTAK